MSGERCVHCENPDVYTLVAVIDQDEDFEVNLDLCNCCHMTIRGKYKIYNSYVGDYVEEDNIIDSMNEEIEKEIDEQTDSEGDSL